jgi:hypothetical protein
LIFQEGDKDAIEKLSKRTVKVISYSFSLKISCIFYTKEYCAMFLDTSMEGFVVGVVMMNRSQGSTMTTVKNC